MAFGKSTPLLEFSKFRAFGPWRGIGKNPLTKKIKNRKIGLAPPAYPYGKPTIFKKQIFSFFKGDGLKAASARSASTLYK